MNPVLAQKLMQEIGSLVVQCHSLQTELDEAQAHIKELEGRIAALVTAKVAAETPAA